nr:NADH dehydrogenase subunit 6 [Lernaea cyprinacea]
MEFIILTTLSLGLMYRSQSIIKMTGLLLGLTIIASLYLGKASSNWIMYTLIVVYMGGVMVLMIYMASTGYTIQPYMLNKTKYLINFSKMMFLLMAYSFNTGLPTLPSIESLSSFYTQSSAWPLMLILLTILFMLILVVNITCTSNSPLKLYFNLASI